MADSELKQRKWREVDEAFKAYNKARIDAEQRIQLQEKIRQEVYEKMSTGTATAEDVALLPKDEDDPYSHQGELGRHFDQLSREYDQFS